MRIIRPNAGFIIPEKRFVDVGMPRGQVQMKGRYRLTVRNARGNAVRGTDWFPNIILDSGLNRWGTGAIISGAAIGTGTSTPASTQTGLDTQVTFTTTTGTGHNTLTAAGSSPYNNSRVFVYRTALGALSGNYTEVGVGWASGSMFSRALILDGLGSPTTISVASDEQLDIEYELQVYPPLTDWTDTVSITGVGSVGVTGRACDVTDTTPSGSGDPTWMVLTSSSIAISSNAGVVYSGTIGSITGNPSGNTGSGGTGTSDSYVNNSLTRTGYYSYGLTNGNPSGGIKSSTSVWSNTFSFQYEFDTAIAKDSTKTLVLNYSVSWARRP